VWSDVNVANALFHAFISVLYPGFIIKEHQKVQKLEAALATVEKRLKEQDAKIDKVNATVELTWRLFVS
jgi:hypothetical protein